MYLMNFLLLGERLCEGFVEPLEGFVEPLEGFVEPLENRRFSDQASAAKQNLDSTPRISKHCVAKQRKSGVECHSLFLLKMHTLD